MRPKRRFPTVSIQPVLPAGYFLFEDPDRVEVDRGAASADELGCSPRAESSVRPERRYPEGGSYDPPSACLIATVAGHPACLANTIPRVAQSAAGPWPIPLRRSIPRLAFVVGLRAAIGVAAIFTATATFGLVATILNLTGAACLLYALLLGLYLFSLRLVAIPNELQLRSVFGTRRYPLRRGEVRRLWVQFSRLPLEARVGTVGVRVGEGQLGAEKLVDVIALDQVSTLLMVPVEGGRLAVAPENEGTLISALGRAAP